MSQATVSVASLDATTMTERLVAEGLIGLAPAARLFGTGRNGRGKHPSTLTRYHHEGVPLPDGTVVKLECVRTGASLMTTRQAVLRFIARQQIDPPSASGAAQSPQSPRARSRASEAASAELDVILG